TILALTITLETSAPTTFRSPEPTSTVSATRSSSTANCSLCVSLEQAAVRAATETTNNETQIGYMDVLLAGRRRWRTIFVPGGERIVQFPSSAGRGRPDRPSARLRGRLRAA